MRGSRGANAAKHRSMQTRMPSLHPSLSHMTSLTPPKTKPCHKRERDTAISQTSSVHITRGGGVTEPLQSITAHCTALHSQAINGTWERGCKGGERGGGGARGSPELWAPSGQLVADRLPSAASLMPTSLTATQLIGNRIVDIKTRQWGHVTGWRDERRASEPGCPRRGLDWNQT